MLALSIDSFDVELTEGSIQNVGAPTKSATAKLFEPAEVTVRGFGDSRAKMVATDEDGNEVQIALAPEQVATVVEDCAVLRTDHPAFEG